MMSSSRYVLVHLRSLGRLLMGAGHTGDRSGEEGAAHEGR